MSINERRRYSLSPYNNAIPVFVILQGAEKFKKEWGSLTSNLKRNLQLSIKDIDDDLQELQFSIEGKQRDTLTELGDFVKSGIATAGLGISAFLTKNAGLWSLFGVSSADTFKELGELATSLFEPSEFDILEKSTSKVIEVRNKLRSLLENKDILPQGMLEDLHQSILYTSNVLEDYRKQIYKAIQENRDPGKLNKMLGLYKSVVAEIDLELPGVREQIGFVRNFNENIRKNNSEVASQFLQLSLEFSEATEGLLSMTDFEGRPVLSPTVLNENAEKLKAFLMEQGAEIVLQFSDGVTKEIYRFDTVSKMRKALDVFMKSELRKQLNQSTQELFRSGDEVTKTQKGMAGAGAALLGYILL